MKNLKLGFIGTGNIGYAMIKAITKSEVMPKNNIFAFDKSEERLKVLQNETGTYITSSIKELVQKSDIIILAVKPDNIKEVLEPTQEYFDKAKILISVAVGVSIHFYESILGEDKKIVRTMPNMPVMVNEGMTLVCSNKNLVQDELNIVKSLFDLVGKTEFLEEKLMCEVTALTSSSPAYLFMFIEAMADAAVLSGISRDASYRLAAQSILGSAKMIIETGKHPAELKDMICSPGGTTIEAVRQLEKSSFRSTIIEAMTACTKKAKEISKNFE